jgi:hypothetical protein
MNWTSSKKTRNAKYMLMELLISIITNFKNITGSVRRRKTPIDWKKPLSRTDLTKARKLAMIPTINDISVKTGVRFCIGI